MRRYTVYMETNVLTQDPMYYFFNFYCESTYIECTPPGMLPINRKRN
jgi:hypothetical protein